MNEQSSGFQKVVRDIWDLCELQMQLLSVDSQSARRKLARAAACAVTAATLGGSALTILLGGSAVFVSERTVLSAGTALLITALGVFVVVAALVLVSVLAIRSAMSSLERTKSEFSENVRWLKATIVAPKTSPRNQLRRETFSRRPNGFDGASMQRHTESPSETPTYSR